MGVGDSLEVNSELALSESAPFDLVSRGYGQFLPQLLIVVNIRVNVLISA